MSPQTLSFPDWWVGGRERRRCYWTWWKNFFRVDEQIVAEMKRITLGLSSAPVTQNMKTHYQGTVSSCLPKRWVTQRVEFSWSTEQNFLHLKKHTRISHQLNHCTTNINFRLHKYLSISSTSPILVYTKLVCNESCSSQSCKMSIFLHSSFRSN